MTVDKRMRLQVVSWRKYRASRHVEVDRSEVKVEVKVSANTCHNTCASLLGMLENAQLFVSAT